MATIGKFVGRVATTETDTYGQGRWCYTCISGRYGKTIYIVTLYRVSQESTSKGETMAHKQQVRLLRKREIENPNPKKQWGEDLTPIIKSWIAQGAQVLLMLEAKSPLTDHWLHQLGPLHHKNHRW